MKLNADNTPAVNVHVPAAVTMLVEVGLEIPYGGAEVPQLGPIDTSPGAKPLPETVTTVPTGPEIGLSIIVGEVLVTVNVAWATSPTGSPST